MGGAMATPSPPPFPPSLLPGSTQPHVPVMAAAGLGPSDPMDTLTHVEFP